MKLNDKLRNINTYPFHMPGHKRNSDMNIIGSKTDITEIDGYDNLHSADGIILDVENELTKTYYSEKSYMLVGGSTCGILSSIFAVCNEGDTIIIARNCHKSVYNACYLRKLKVKYIYPKECAFGCSGISQADVDQAVKESPQAKAIIITSPTYDGIISRIKSKLPIIIDSAHGAHFDINETMPHRLEGSIIINSLHKTLPCLTQTAVVNVYDEKYTKSVKKYIDIFETSSPSYVLMSSVAQCMDIIKRSELFDTLNSNLNGLYDVLNNCKNLIYCNCDTNGGFEQDKTRLSITSDKNITGIEIADILRRDFNIEPEMASRDTVVLITTIADTAYGFFLLKKALKSIDERIESLPNKDKALHQSIHLNQVNYSWEIKDTTQNPLQSSVGKISAEYVYAYPPGIPIIVPGEEITDYFITSISDMLLKNVNIISDSHLLPQEILTKA